MGFGRKDFSRNGAVLATEDTRMSGQGQVRTGILLSLDILSDSLRHCVRLLF